MKHIFIINPVSGKGRSLKVKDNIVEVCNKENMEYEIIETSMPNEATKIAKKYSHNKNNIIYSVGGDGTLNEVLNGMVNSKCMLGIVPCGSGNDFYKTLNKIDDPLPLIDVGKINDKYFINIVSIGIDAEVADNVSIMKKKNIKTEQIYNASLVYTFFKYKFKDINYEINGESKNGKCTILTICNGQIYGGGFKIAPEATLTDGYFDIYFVDKIAKTSLPYLLGLLKKGTHAQNKKVHHSKATNIKFKSEKELVCNIDGEIIKDTKFKIELLPKKLLIYNDKDLIDRFLKKRF